MASRGGGGVCRQVGLATIKLTTRYTQKLQSFTVVKQWADNYQGAIFFVYFLTSNLNL